MGEPWDQFFNLPRVVEQQLRTSLKSIGPRSAMLPAGSERQNANRDRPEEEARTCVWLFNRKERGER
jgi:hypothetical protein